MVADENFDEFVPAEQESRLEKEREVVLASEELVPKLTRPNYYTEPSLTRLCRMSEEELSQVKDFSVGNEFGKIMFEGKTDVRGLDLDDIINIKSKTVIHNTDTSF